MSISITPACAFGVGGYTSVISHTGIAVSFVVAAAHGVILHSADTFWIYFLRVDAGRPDSSCARTGENAA